MNSKGIALAFHIVAITCAVLALFIGKIDKVTGVESTDPCPPNCDPASSCPTTDNKPSKDCCAFLNGLNDSCICKYIQDINDFFARPAIINNLTPCNYKTNLTCKNN
ncbi:hypothetical protein CASFOL_020601 [Castilleja foliolosa]|uniref:Uncharacterized protein n=1 Tax=Castilleja foliolosa TaxID=1961234 RepID=A0ABD3D487_9LAMI